MAYLSDEEVARIRAKYPEIKGNPPLPQTFTKGGVAYANKKAAGKPSYVKRTTRIRYSEEEQPCYVYFIQSEDNKFIKIGYTTDLNKRKSQLQMGSAAKLMYIGTILFQSEEKAIEVESAIHNLFNDLQLHGEWFMPDDRLLQFVKTHIRDTDELASALESTPFAGRK